MKIILTIAIIYAVYLVVRFTVVLINLLHWPFLRKVKIHHENFVSLCIPARNEEATIGKLLNTLSNLEYEHFEILVYNDNSTDGTEQHILEARKRNKNIHILNGIPLPDGWLGKNHACFQLAQKAKGEYILFLDADVTPSPNLINTLITEAKNKKLQLLSVFPRQITHSLGEKLVVPHMKNILLSLLPIFYVNKSNRVSFSAANGQCMLFHAPTYKKLQPHKWVKQEKVEDIAIMRLYKKFHFQTAAYLGNGNIACKMYASGQEAINGFSRNIQHFFSDSTAFMLFHVFITSFGFFSLAVLPPKLLFFLIFTLLIMQTGLLVLSQRKWWELFLVPAQQVALLYLAIVSIYKHKKGTLFWKGRQINGK